MADEEAGAIPDWRDPSAGGGLVRAASWLMELGENKVFTKRDLREAFPDIAQIDRRVRDLRDYGWVINTSREDSELAQNEQRFVKRGVAVWDPKQRRNTARTEANPGAAASDSSRSEAGDLAAQIAKLTATERTRLLAWIAMGDRPRTAVEEIWDLYAGLPVTQRQDLTRELARQVDQDSTSALNTAQAT
ncbi:hypothetical protein AB0M94_07715 [Streptomyces xanthochromogenes]|uniref:hypothetical protein n=1 Tax=Streptomyces xanthochromogenes TaxID=67384 RepID=UPI0034374DFA